MPSHIKRLKNNDFMRNNAIFFAGSLFVSFINYLYYPILGRLLSLESFGELQVLISFFAQITIFISVLTLIATNVIINEKNTAVVNRTVSELEKITLYASYAVLALITLLSPFLASALKFESAWPFIIITLVFVAGIPLGFRTAYLRGKNDFTATSIEGILASVSKIIASAVLVVIGFKTAGAAGGILIAQLIALGYAGYKARKLGFIKQKSSSRPNWNILRPQAKYGGLVLFVSLICTILYTIDILLIKYLFTPEVAGQYAGMATISRIILFLTGSFAIVLLSSVKLDRKPKENSKLLIRSLALTTVLGGVATLLFVFFPTQVIHLLFGTKYDAFAHLLPLLSVAMIMMSLNNLIANYHVALRHYWVMLYVGIGAFATVICVILNHSSPDAVVQSIAVGSGVMLFGLVAWTGYRAYV